MQRLLLTFVVLACVNVSMGQVVIWQDDFGSGCNAGQLATAYSSPSGSWTQTLTGINDGTPNNWFVGATENGNAPGQCGSACGTDATLHLGAEDSPLGTDLGAAYFEGLTGLCDLVGCAATDKRIESPAINCSLFHDITVEFDYIEGGNALDNGTLWYFDGASWSQIYDMAKTAYCGQQGVWAHLAVTLPVSASYNPNIRIAFRWVNNDDGDAQDPSLAVDDIEVIGFMNGGDITPPIVECPGPLQLPCSQPLPDLTLLSIVSDDLDPNPTVYQSYQVGTILTSDITIMVSATDFSGNMNACAVFVSIVNGAPPTISCPNDVTINVASGISETNINLSPAVLASDECGVPIVTNDYNSNPNASGIYPVGTTIVTFTATDNFGASTSCSTTVNVLVNTTCCDGDFNCDGIINVTDMSIFLSNYGCTGCIADLNADGSVNVDDLLIMTGIFGSVCP